MINACEYGSLRQGHLQDGHGRLFVSPALLISALMQRDGMLNTPRMVALPMNGYLNRTLPPKGLRKLHFPSPLDITSLNLFLTFLMLTQMIPLLLLAATATAWTPQSRGSLQPHTKKGQSISNILA